ncbi:hypothetical protein ADK53_30495 [Streptomyces sp. WM6373]|uniref:hypothetical protein n=1 Tax=Streptomyces sp. WM6373 TaxID=1415556 RepID=UPI0006AF2A89|nr:hypothetical protein [Streptomyces sp. WM6373]KOU29998.1 hypothetical protein ADK53_30495 [Streptomyces sp. WM6373]
MSHIMPDPVVDLIESHYPDRIREAARDLRVARARYLMCRTAVTAVGREWQIADMHRALKVLATHPQPTEVVR